jgi:hypothetical protein
MAIRNDMQDLLEKRELSEAYKSPVAAMEKFQKAVMAGDTPHKTLAKLLYDALMAAHDSMTSKGGLKGKLGEPLTRAAGMLLKIR